MFAILLINLFLDILKKATKIPSGIDIINVIKNTDKVVFIPSNIAHLPLCITYLNLILRNI